VEPVLRQLVKLEQQYETDMTVLALAGQKAQLMQKYGIDQVTDEMLNQELTVMVNVGMGATNPEMKLQKFVLATKTYAEARQALPDADPLAIRKEIFGLAGYRDGARFFREDGDPMQQQMQQMQQMLQQAQAGMEQMQAEIATLKRDNAAKAVQALSDADLKQAQTVKTLAEAAILPSQQLMQQAITPEGVGNEQ
jgi:cysteinyl-tRNA synthetase